MQHYKLVSEILTEAGELPEIEDQAIALKSSECLTLRQILKAGFDPQVSFDVTLPTYKSNLDAPGCSSNNLYLESRRLYVFLKGSKVNAKRRSVLLAQILESIDADDAKLLVHVIKKDMSSYGVSKEAVKLAFPGLLAA